MDNPSLAAEVAELERKLAEMKAVLQSQAETVEDHATVTPRRDPGRARLSFMQEQLWFLDQLNPGRPTYNLSIFLRLTGDLELPALHIALTALVARHEALRTTFAVQEQVPWQIIHPPAPADLPLIDISDRPQAEREAELQQLLRAQALRAFAIEREIPFRFRLIKLTEREHVLALTAHHISFDGASATLLIAELSELYSQARGGGVPSLPPLTLQFPDFAEWQQNRLASGLLERDLAYWTDQLANAGTLHLPTDRPRPDLPSLRGDRFAYTMPLDVLEGLRAVARRCNATLFAALIACFTATLSRWADTSDVVIATANAGRQRPELQGIVGCLINMLVLRMDFADDPTLDAATRRAMMMVAEAWEHQSAPFEKIIERLGVPRDPSRNPVFQIAIDLHPGDAFTWTFPGLDVETISSAQATARFDMAINSFENTDGLLFRVEYATDLFDPARIERLMGHFEQMMRAAAADPEVRVSQVSLLTEAERRQIMTQWQGEDLPQSPDPVHTQIAAIAAAHPEAIASRMAGADLTYAELERRANALAHRLRGHGVGHGDIVAVALGRGFELLVGMVATLKAGGAFVIVDATHPEQRLAFLFADTAAKVVITDTASVSRLPAPDGWTPLLIDAEWSTLDVDTPALPELTDENSLAYVLYTSGSTGKPKGVMVEHHALTTFTLWMGRVCDFKPGTRTAHFMALIFDFAVGEIFTALVTGATLVFVSDAVRLDPTAFGDLLDEEHITYLGGPPAVLASLPARPYPDLKTLIAGGEALLPEIVNQWNVPGRRFINGYGPTEAAIGCIYHICEHVTWTSQPPIGRPMPRRTAYILDQHGNLCPIGIPGEIVVGGAGIARGYLNLPEHTRQQFEPDPYFPGRMYHTGDLGLWNEDGTITFLGRIDSQVKLNGLRIELEEIDAALTTHPQITAAAVIVREDVPGNKHLAAYIVAGTPAPTWAELTDHLSLNLPRYMIPATFTALTQLPLTPVGKTDRAALAALAPNATPGSRTLKPAGTPTERTVAETFAGILTLQNINTDDNFFALGGNSLQAARVVLELRAKTGLEIPLTLLYTKPTVADLARALESPAPAATTVADTPEDSTTPSTLPPRASGRFREVLLTGSTGYFGAFLLDEILSQTDAVVCCLVRADSEEQAWERLESNLARFDRAHADLRQRVWILRGDLGEERLGLSAAEYARSARRFDTIVHSAAHVNLLFHYSQLEPVNVGGTRRLIEFAATEVLKELHFVSTVGARYGAEYDPVALGYAGTKWSAERVVVAARARGVPASVYRLPRIAGDSRTASSNDRDAIMVLVGRFLTMGALSELDFQEEWVPVDVAARTLLETALSHDDGGLFTIEPAEAVRIQRVVELAADAANLPLLSQPQFMQHIAEKFPEQREVLQGILARGQLPVQAKRSADDAIADEPFALVRAAGVDEVLLERIVARLVETTAK